MQPTFVFFSGFRMNKRNDLGTEPCPVARSISVVGDRWSLLLVRDAFDGVCRFSDFQRSLGVARNILAERLRRLVDAGILETRPGSNGGAHQEYVLTAQGQSLFPVVVALRQWGERHLFEQGEPHSELVEKSTGQPLHFMAPQAADGRPISPGDTEVRKLA
jgi:DNA-binding HxlR family transcriptional regulator